MAFNSFDFADKVCTALMGNLDTLGTGNDALNIWTNTTASLNTTWQTGPIGGNTDIDNQIAAIAGASNPQDAQKLMAAFITNEMTAENVNKFNVGNISALLSALAGACQGGGDAGASQMASIQSYGNLVTAQQQLQTSTGDTESKSQASFIQQATSAQQPIADLGSSVVALLNISLVSFL